LNTSVGIRYCNADWNRGTTHWRGKSYRQLLTIRTAANNRILTSLTVLRIWIYRITSNLRRPRI
jgi:hypothetical protein